MPNLTIKVDSAIADNVTKVFLADITRLLAAEMKVTELVCNVMAITMKCSGTSAPIYMELVYRKNVERDEKHITNIGEKLCLHCKDQFNTRAAFRGFPKDADELVAYNLVVPP